MRTMIILLVLAVLALAFDVLNAPWAYSIFGRPTLTGRWFGTFTTPSGIRFALDLELDRSFFTADSSRLSGNLFNGKGRWCDDRGRRSDNNVISASAPMFSGYGATLDRVTIHLDPASPPPLGLVPLNLRGQWRRDTLTLTSDLPYWTGQGFRTSTADVDQNRPVAITLTKADGHAFDSACAGWSAKRSSERHRVDLWGTRAAVRTDPRLAHPR
jgi:hypothetical protein